MGRKRIGRLPKSGTKGSSCSVSKRRNIRPDVERAGHYKTQGASTKSEEKKGTEYCSSNSDADNDADDEYNEHSAPPVPKLMSLVVGNRRYLFGESSCIPSEKELDFEDTQEQKQQSILYAVHNSGKSVHEKVAALIIAINDPSVQVLFEAAGIIMTSLSLTEQLVTSDVDDSPILPQALFQEPTQGIGEPNRSDLRKKCNLKSVPMEPVEEDAFKFTITGEPRKNTSGKASQMAKSRQVTKIRNSILNSGLSHAQQIVALHDAANHPQL